MSAYAGDDSEEAKATIQELKVQLDESRQNLEETEMDKYIEDTSKLLDSLYLEYETILNARLDNIDSLVMQQIEYINQNATNIQQTLIDQATAVGTQLSTEMQQIWNTDDIERNGDKVKNVIDFYGKDFGSKLTTVNQTIQGITAKVQDMVNKLDQIANQKVNQAGNSSASKPSGGNSGNNKPSTTPKPSNNGGDGVPRVGDAVRFNSGIYYYSSDGKKPAGSQMLGQTVYITQVNNASWAKMPYHIARDKAGKRPLGWVTLGQISGYASGKHKLNDNEYAWTQENGAEMIVRPSDGAILTPLAKNDSVLTSAASRNIWDMANNPTDFIKNNLGVDMGNVPNGNGSNNSYVQNIDNVVFSMPNVKNYDQMIRTMQKDKNFERLVNAMTIDQIAGGSKLAKGKAIK